MVFKIGDKVKIRNDFIGEREIGGVFIVNKMCEYRGLITKITDIVYDDFFEKEVIKLENDPVWVWPEEALIPFTQTKEDCIAYVTERFGFNFQLKEEVNCNA